MVVNANLFNNTNILPIYASNRAKIDTICASSPGLPAVIGAFVTAQGSNSFNLQGG